MKRVWAFAIVAAMMCLPALVGAQAIVVSAEPLNTGTITNRQSGQFIEYLCNLVPGMWSEKLYDGGFEGLSPYKFEFIRQTDFREKPWYPSGAVNRGEYTADTDQPFSGQRSQRIRVAGGAPCMLGISQDGIALDPSRGCSFTVYLREQGVQGPVTVRLHDEGRAFASATIDATEQWKKYSAHLVPTAAADDNATLEIAFRGPGTLWIDNASLLPDDAVEGWRPDAATALKELHPGVIRFGGSALDSQGYGDFEWRDTIGPIDRRKPMRAWGGLQQPGAGLEEIVQLMQSSGAEPLICVRFNGRSAKDAADEVEYLNGPADSPMGRLRAANGHPAPCAIRYWQAGNELSGPEYEAKLPDFCRAMKAADPHILLCSSFPTPGVLRGAGQWIDYVCPHHYDCADLAGVLRNLDEIRAMLAADAPGRNIHVAVTEWNTTAGDAGVKRARLWTLENALACARYQNLLQRQCDLVEIACRSNLCNSFCSGIIQTDNHRLYKTPTYYLQQLFATSSAARPLKVKPAFSAENLPDVSAALSADGKVVTLFAVNPTLEDLSRTLDFSAFVKGARELKIWTLSDRDNATEPDVTNSFADPERITAVAGTLPVASSGDVHYRFPKLSVTRMEFQVK
jgi:alpha-N-arabinofuranosidase